MSAYFPACIETGRLQEENDFQCFRVIWFGRRTLVEQEFLLAQTQNVFFNVSVCSLHFITPSVKTT